MKDYSNRINRLKIDIELLEEKIEKADENNRPAYSKRLKKILEKENAKLQKWLKL